MYLEVVKDIQALEAQIEQDKAQARTRGQEAVNEAQRQGRALLAEKRDAIREADNAAMVSCQAQADRRRGELLSGTEQEIASLRAQAEQHMDDAVARIMEKVVGR